MRRPEVHSEHPQCSFPFESPLMQFTEHDALEAAIAVAQRSPCRKSTRGVVIFNTRGVVAQGFNHPPEPFLCTGDDECRASCNKICVHAEQAALLDYDGRGNPADEPDLLHVKVERGVGVPSGPPSCWQCSRLILLVPDIQGVWLLHGGALCRYSPVEFHRQTLRNCGLPMWWSLSVDGRCGAHQREQPS